jgi:hypothetical protein
MSKADVSNSYYNTVYTILYTACIRVGYRRFLGQERGWSHEIERGLVRR